ncbi:unnamed protein product [Prunus armeniaca]|uniref:Suppressor of forked domain-containing protein n=1 Tax=Prunus armeniaca TaxID=36596 RepID=A0A6J5YAQ7_PRUAR|nr:unnamed protein product [Prunus armeniaca]
MSKAVHNMADNSTNTVGRGKEIWLEESAGNKDRIREVYERAIANVPPVPEKRYWQRYIYLWINYALYEELDAGGMERARYVYCLQLIPHKKFSFAKIWLLAAGFEIRQLNLEGARKILGTAIGKSPKDKIFNKYIEIELNLGNFDECRKLCGKYLHWSPENCYAWTKYAELEKSLCDSVRQNGLGRFLNLPSPNQHLTCLNCCGRHTLTLNYQKVNLRELENFTRDSS